MGYLSFENWYSWPNLEDAQKINHQLIFLLASSASFSFALAIAYLCRSREADDARKR